MNINLDLTKHCIQTEIKKLYNKSIMQYFKHGADKVLLEKRIDIFNIILENCDFAHLRSSYPELCGKHDTIAALSVNRFNQFYVQINGKMIKLF